MQCHAVYSLLIYTAILLKYTYDSEQIRRNRGSDPEIYTFGASTNAFENSVTSDFEARLLLQDSIDGIVREAEAFISYLYCMVSMDKRNTLLSRYRELLKDMISDVDMVLKKK